MGGTYPLPPGLDCCINTAYALQNQCQKMDVKFMNYFLMEWLERIFSNNFKRFLVRGGISKSN